MGNKSIVSEKKCGGGKTFFGDQGIGGDGSGVCQPCGGRHESGTGICRGWYGNGGRYESSTGICRGRSADSIGSGGRYGAGSRLRRLRLSAIDRAVRQNSGYSISFQEIINQITGEDGVTGQGFFPVLNKTFLQVITGSKTAVVQIIILALFSAAIRCFGPSACKEQISDTAQMILSISLTAVLIASFYTACTISTDTLEGCISVYKAVVPVFFSAVAFASGNVTAAVYYEIVLMLITTVNLLFKSVLIKVDQIYMLISMADAVAKEERFTKAAELCVQVMKWSGRTALVVFTGLGGLKGMLVPVSETYKKKMLYRAVQTLPGVGSSIETVTQTVWGAAKIIKNGIGMAAVIAVLIVCAVPVLKLVLMAVLFKVTAAVIEPVADKRVVKAVNALGTAVGMLLMTVLAAVSLFLLMLAMIVMMTGLQ